MKSFQMWQLLLSGDFFKLRGRTKCSVASIICELLEEAKAAYTLECMQPSLSLLGTYLGGVELLLD